MKLDSIQRDGEELQYSQLPFFAYQYQATYGFGKQTWYDEYGSPKNGTFVKVVIALKN